jgi:hypothetical protein
MRTGFPATMAAVAILHAAVLDRVAVTVGKDVITESEVIEDIRLTDFLNQSSLDVSPAERRTAANRLVDQDLLRDEMQLEGFPMPGEGAADQTLQEFKRAHFRTDAAYRSALKRYGITENELKQYLLWQIATLRFTEQRFRPGAPTPPPTPQKHTTVQAQVQTSQRLQRADRQANPQQNAGTTVDQQLDAWLKQARAQTHIEFHKEAFE